VPDCRHCDAVFDHEAAYAEHLQAEHAEELGAIDRHRVEAHASDDESSFPTTPVVLGLVLLTGVAVIVAAWVAFAGGGSNTGAGAGQQPSGIGTVHYHGSIEMVVDGDRVDFSQDRYQLQADPFHFENGGGTRWHVHAQDVTLEYAMTTLGFDVTADSVTYEGTTYRDNDQGTSVSVAVNGEQVTPSEYVLQEGDRVRIVVVP
jgi:sulfur carrier protein ThiS